MHTRNITARLLASIGDEIAHHSAPASSNGKVQRMVIRRRRFKHSSTLNERLDQELVLCRAQAKDLPLGQEREKLIRKIRQAETAMQIDAWLASPGLRAPR